MLSAANRKRKAVVIDNKGNGSDGDDHQHLSPPQSLFQAEGESHDQLVAIRTCW